MINELFELGRHGYGDVDCIWWHFAFFADDACPDAPAFETSCPALFTSSLRYMLPFGKLASAMLG